VTPVSTDPFAREHTPPIGAPETLAPGVVAVTAPNAGPMTFTGTRSYLVGDGPGLALIDPGPDDPAHVAAVCAAVPLGARIEAILVTHAHLDHSGAAAAMRAATGAPVLAFGPPVRSAAMTRFAAAGGLGGGEGFDRDFAPDRLVADGEALGGAGWALEAIHTPGHLGDHLAYAWAGRGALFTGDVLMGWSTTLISPPDGDLGAFLASLRRLRARPEGTAYPGHGAPLRDPAAMIDWQVAHRAEREAQIRAALASGPSDAASLARLLYAGLDPRLRPAAERNVLAHLLDLAERGLAVSEGPPGAAAIFRDAS
jgi:glyoxylase-like metal-dependent hydrolase (beta-lactamase superfamily II)